VDLNLGHFTTTSMELIIEVLGWVGSVMILAAYGLNSYQKIQSDSWAFLLLNGMGGLFLIVYTVHKEAYANTFINIAWVVIAIPALLRRLLKQR
jgi:hypothetical protein